MLTIIYWTWRATLPLRAMIFAPIQRMLGMDTSLPAHGFSLRLSKKPFDQHHGILWCPPHLPGFGRYYRLQKLGKCGRYYFALYTYFDDDSL
jgi:hypothetical protein